MSCYVALLHYAWFCEVACGRLAYTRRTFCCAMAKARHALRSVLRVVDQHLTKVNNNKFWRNHVIQQFRQAAKSDPAEQQQLLQQAKDYAYLVTSVQEHRVSTRLQHDRASSAGPDLNADTQALLLSYNIGVDREQERKKLMSDTAARVGLRMPKFAEDA